MSRAVRVPLTKHCCQQACRMRRMLLAQAAGTPAAKAALLQGGAAHISTPTQASDFSCVHLHLSPAQMKARATARRGISKCHGSAAMGIHAVPCCTSCCFEARFLAGWLAQAADVPAGQGFTLQEGQHAPWRHLAVARERSLCALPCDAYAAAAGAPRPSAQLRQWHAFASPSPWVQCVLQVCTCSVPVPATSRSSSIRQLWHAPAAEHGAPAGHWHGLRLTV